jgi:DUF1016 N-terminal domain
MNIEVVKVRKLIKPRNTQNTRENDLNQSNSTSLGFVTRIRCADELRGNYRADYGKEVLKSLSERLTRDFGKGFDITNLRKMKRFYSLYPKLDAVRLELSWTHYRL